MLAEQLKDMLGRFELSDSRMLGITIDNASSNHSMTCELQSTLVTSGIEWPALRNHIRCMAHVIQLASGAFMSSLGVKGCTKSWEAHEHDRQFGEKESMDIGKSQRLRKEGIARINKVSAMRPHWAKIIDKVCISRYFESHETDLHIAVNACSIVYADTWSSKRVHWLSQSHTPQRVTTEYGYEDMLELKTGVAWEGLPTTRIHLRVARKSKIQWLPATYHNTGWMDHCIVGYGSFKAILILDPLDVEEEYGHIASRCHSLQWHVWSCGWCHERFG